MSAERGSDNRVVLPRWRPWKVSETNRELSSLRVGASAFDEVSTTEEIAAELEKRFDAYEISHGPHFATDLLGTALVLGVQHSPEVQSIASHFLDSRNRTINSLARRITVGVERESVATLAPPGEEAGRLRIAGLRKLVQRQPHNALAWADLALAETVVGNSESAERAIRVALSLAKENRFILRAASRFYMVSDDFERARDVLSNQRDLLVSDPWLLSAEIAISDLEGRSSKFLRVGRRLLEDDFAPRDRSELASALATVELRSGRTKIARRFMSESLLDPTDNSLAQAEWSADRGLDLVRPKLLNEEPCGFEARARNYYRQLDFDKAVGESILWQADQPFALDSASFLSFISSTFANRFDVAVTACETGLISHPRNVLLLNNLAFALGCMGMTSEATEVLRRPREKGSAGDEAMLTATRGLIAFRQSESVKGRELYRSAVDQFLSCNDRRRAIIAALFWAREERVASTGLSVQVREVAKSLGVLKMEDADLRLIRMRLEGLL